MRCLCAPLIAKAAIARLAQPLLTTGRVVNELLGMMAISILSKDGFRTAFTIYGINNIGRSLLRRPELEDELTKEIYSKKRRPFSVVNDRIQYI